MKYPSLVIAAFAASIATAPAFAQTMNSVFAA